MDTIGRVGTWTCIWLTHSRMPLCITFSHYQKRQVWMDWEKGKNRLWSDLCGMLPRWRWPCQIREAERQIWVEKQIMVRRRISLIMNLTIWNFWSKFVFVLIRENLKILNHLIIIMTKKSINCKNASGE